MPSPNFNDGIDEEEEANGNHHELSDYYQLVQGYKRTHEVQIEFGFGLDSSNNQHPNPSC
jgi:hypothetical protein